MIVSPGLGYADVYSALENAAATLGRKVNPTLYTRAEITKRIKQDNAFVTRVLQGQKIWLMGEEDDINTKPA